MGRVQGYRLVGRRSGDTRPKKAISIRVDEDVLDFFRKEGEGYQRRINAVLRSYMQQKLKAKKRA
ncbi:MAG TPA: BrnA antitoxin family protein [Chthoniobacteraceae bacterium]